MAIPLNTTNEIGVIIEYLTYNVTGDIFLSLICFVIVVLVLALAFRIPLEWTLIFMVPLILAMAAWTNQFLILIGVVIFIFAVLIAKNWLYGG